MSRKPPAAVLWGKLGWHPAVAAWRGVAPDATDPECIEVLRKGWKSDTFRLAGVGPGGGSVIAQRSRRAKASIERMVYEQILPHLPVTAPRFLGAREDDHEYFWLFLEDVGDERCSKTDPDHRALAAHWLALMHTAAARNVAAPSLPDGGPSRYRKHLQADRAIICAHLENPALAPDDRAMLQRLVATLDSLDRRWEATAQACHGMPATLVHGDFQSKNAYVREGVNGPELFPIDWEMAGWGVPAADLVKIDVETYWSVARGSWRCLQRDDVRRLAAVGAVFRALAAISWVAPQLAYDTAHWLILPVSKLRCYDRQLTEATGELGELT